MLHGRIADIFFAVDYEPEQHEPDSEPVEPAPDIFGRVNNYLLLVYAAACFLMYFSLAGILVVGKNIVLSLILPGIIAFILPLLLLSKRFSLNFTKTYRLEVPDLRTAAVVLLIAGSSIIPVEAFSSIFERKWPPDADYINFILSIKPKGILSFITVAFGLVIITPFGEELLFRGFIQRIFQRNMNGPLAVMLAALVFGLVHFELAVIPAIAVLGLIFGYILYRTDNLLYPVLAHALYNLVSLLRLHLTPTAEIEEGGYSSLPTTWALVSFFLLVLGILLLERWHTAPQEREDE